MEKIYIFAVITTFYLLLITLSLLFNENRKLEIFFFIIGLILVTISIYYPLFFSGWYKLLFLVGLFVFYAFLLNEEAIKISFEKLKLIKKFKKNN